MPAIARTIVGVVHTAVSITRALAHAATLMGAALTAASGSGEQVDVSHARL